MKKAVVYCRVSDSGQLAGSSLEVQKEFCKKWAKEHDYKVVHYFKDEAKTGTKMVGRDDLENLIIYCQDKKNIDAVLTIDSDRIARNEYDYFYIKNELKKAGTNYIAVNQPIMDGSPEGQLMEGVLTSINAFYSRLTGKKVKHTLEKKCNEGIYPGWATLGYKNVNTGTIEKPIRVIKIDDEKAQLVKRIFELFATGRYSLDELVIETEKEGLTSKKGKKLCRTTIDSMLKNIFYIGKFKYSGKIWQGKHTPLISKELFDTCQSILAIHNKFACRKRKYKWLLNGMVYCQTHNSRLFGDYAKKKTKAYYHGQANKGCRHYIPVAELEGKVIDELRKIKFSDEYIQIIINKAKSLIKLTKEEKETKIRGIQNRLKGLEDKKNKLLDGYLDSVISRDTYEKKSPEYDLNIEIAENEINNIKNSDLFNIDAVLEILNLTKDVAGTFEKAHFEAKRYYLSLFFNQININDKGEIVEIKYTEIFENLIKADCVRVTSDLLALLDSNQKPFR
jgi:DNA invertase Pin-like site-specific DNA recombinase